MGKTRRDAPWIISTSALLRWMSIIFKQLGDGSRVVGHIARPRWHNALFLISLHLFLFPDYIFSFFLFRRQKQDSTFGLRVFPSPASLGGAVWICRLGRRRRRRCAHQQSSTAARCCFPFSIQRLIVHRSPPLSFEIGRAGGGGSTRGDRSNKTHAPPWISRYTKTNVQRQSAFFYTNFQASTDNPVISLQLWIARQRRRPWHVPLRKHVFHPPTSSLHRRMYWTSYASIYLLRAHQITSTVCA